MLDHRPARQAPKHGKRRKQRTVYLSECGCRHVKAWLGDRGDAPRPLSCPVSQTGGVRIRPLRGESIAYILRRRQEQAGSAPPGVLALVDELGHRDRDR
ncbi:MAG: hypothetical protein GY835_03660 [bacterium]|nr:hypothetical protein [bacterium]